MNIGDKVKLSESCLANMGELLSLTTSGKTVGGHCLEDFKSQRGEVRAFDQMAGTALVCWYNNVPQAWVHEDNLQRTYGTTTEAEHAA